ncbi:MAG: DUF4595 domain-containing protein [Tannerella sp.]|jgi:hypothetical protein|nr:DUF4595 domain-containing protein [Tannerella sp.]
MKKLLIFAVLIMTACTDALVNPNDGNGNSQSGDKRITSCRIVSNGITNEFRFKYDTEGRISEMVLYEQFSSGYRMTHHDTLTVMNENNKVTMALIGYEDDDEYRYEDLYSFTLDNNGLATSFLYSYYDYFIQAPTQRQKPLLYGDGYLLGIYLDNHSDDFDYSNFVWENGNLVRLDDDILFSYTNKPDKSFISELFPFLIEFDGPSIDDIMMSNSLCYIGYVNGFLGKPSRNLMESLTYDPDYRVDFNYEFDSDGYVTSATAVFDDGSYFIEFTYE